MTAFSKLKLTPSLLQALDALEYLEMTDIQAGALPAMLSGKDVVAKAKTGSGKTAAFSLAILNALNTKEMRVQSLVLCPTRELADQVSKEIRALARFTPNVKVLSLCGGVSMRPQIASLTHEPHIAVGTPGRIKALIEKGALNISAIESLVLDEADRMLDMGFIDDISDIIKRTPRARKTYLFSATYPEAIADISDRFQNDPVTVSVESQHSTQVIDQVFHKCDIEDKPRAVVNLLLHHLPESCLIFCNTKIDVAALADFLRREGVAAMELQGDLEQRDRDETLLQFSNGSLKILVATDVAARGLDIKNLPMVIAFELPHDPETHVHRVGRTGRAGETGLAVTLVASREMKRIGNVQDISGVDITFSAMPAPTASDLPLSEWKTLMIEAGRRDKIRPGDILGALTGTGGLKAEHIGKIDIFATRAYVAIQYTVIDGAVRKLRDGKIKGKKLRMRKLSS